MAQEEILTTEQLFGSPRPKDGAEEEILSTEQLFGPKQSKIGPERPVDARSPSPPAQGPRYASDYTRRLLRGESQTRLPEKFNPLAESIGPAPEPSPLSVRGMAGRIKAEPKKIGELVKGMFSAAGQLSDLGRTVLDKLARGEEIIPEEVMKNPAKFIGEKISIPLAKGQIESFKGMATGDTGLTDSALNLLLVGGTGATAARAVKKLIPTSRVPATERAVSVVDDMARFGDESKAIKGRPAGVTITEGGKTRTVLKKGATESQKLHETMHRETFEKMAASPEGRKLGMKAMGEVDGNLAKIEAFIKTDNSVESRRLRTTLQNLKDKSEAGEDLQGLLDVDLSLGGDQDLIRTAAKLKMDTDPHALTRGMYRQKALGGKGKLKPENIGTEEILADYFKNKPDKLAEAGLVPTELYAGGGNIGEKAKAGFKTVAQPLIDQMLSPETVLGRNPHGKAGYERLNIADLRKTAFQEREFNKLAAAAKEIEKGRWQPIDTGVFKVLDSKQDLDKILRSDLKDVKRFGLTQDELATMKQNPDLTRQWHGFLKEGYSNLLRTWGKELVGPQRESQLWRLANQPGGKNVNVVQGEQVPPKMWSGYTDAEKEILDVYSRRISDYVTHVFDKDEMLTYLKGQLEQTQSKLSMTTKDSRWWKTLVKEEQELKDSIKSFEGGELFTMSKLPKKLRFKFFERRTGAGGYQVSGAKAYKTYLQGISRKIFDDPAYRFAKEEFEKLPQHMKPYAEQYLKKWIGYERDPVAKAFAAIKSFEWTRTLGFNPRSAIQNWTQKINTFADAGIADSAHGWKKAFEPEMRTLFKKSGLRSQIPTELMETGAKAGKAGIAGQKGGLEKIRELSGYLFSKAEEGNLRHAFSTYYEKARKAGKSSDEAMRLGIEGAQKTQFRYGRVGTPMALRGVGGVAFQFWSYPIKQMEFLSKIAKENPAKLLRWWGLSEGTKTGFDKVLGIDLSSGLGLGVDYGDMLQMLRDIPTGDWKKVEYHAKSGMSAGGGLMPFGLGPGVEAIGRLLKGKSPVLDRIWAEIEPMQLRRMKEGAKAFAGGKDAEGKYTVKSSTTGEPLYRESGKDIVKRTFLGRPMVEKEASDAVRKSSLRKQMGDKIIRSAADMYVNGQTKEAFALVTKYRLQLTRESIIEALKRKTMTKAERIKTPKSRAAFEQELEE